MTPLEHLSGEPVVNALLPDLLRPKDTFFDCGAFEGWLTVVGSRLVGPAGRVVAFEPDPANHRVLVEQLRLEQCENARAELLGVSSRTGVARFSGGGQGGHISEQGRDIRVTSLDAYVSQSGIVPDVIKLDVEGHEAEVVVGGEHLWRDRFPIVVFEQHRDDQSAIDMFRHRGYRVLNLHTYRDYFPLNAIVQNFIAVPPSREGWYVFPQFSLERVAAVYERDGRVETDVIHLQPGKYLLRAHFDCNDSRQAIRFFARGTDRTWAYDGDVFWISSSYAQIPWFADRPSHVTVGVEFRFGVPSDFQLDPVEVVRMA